MVMNRIWTSIATLGPIGYIPFAPGTFGSLAGLILFALFRPSSVYLVVIISAGFLSGVYASTVAEQLLNEKDSGKIVIDEAVGILVSFLFLPPAMAYLVAAFLLFRAFDIIKPFPIRHIEKKLHAGIGVMADDIIAGMYANILLHLWILIF
jgi:phosphatidylglycerophosphatase A